MIAAPPPAAGWSEAYTASGRPRPLYGGLLERLAGVDLAGLKAGASERMERSGASFGGLPFAVCPVPRLIAAAEWRELEAGLGQRARALSAFVLDAYGPREIVSAGVMPGSVIDEAEGFEPELSGRWPAGQHPLGVIGMDVVRDPSGELLLLEDNTRTPSGYSYALATRDAVSDTLDELAPALGRAFAPVPLESPTLDALRSTLGDAAAGANARTQNGAIVVLTDGPSSVAYYEHGKAAAWVGAPLVTLADLARRGDELWLAPGNHGAAQPVSCVYRRTDGERLRDQQGRMTAVAELLLEPWLAGRVRIVNAFGAGVADDKLAHAYVEDMIRFYLGQEPRLRSVPTLDLADPRALEEVLADLRGHVVKPRHGQGGHGVVVCAHAEEEDVRQVAAELREPDPGARFVAQRTVLFSTSPTVVGDRLAERHVDLRPFVFSTRDAVVAIPGGLTRVAWDEGALVVNSSQNGGAKDTWVLA